MHGAASTKNVAKKPDERSRMEKRTNEFRRVEIGLVNVQGLTNTKAIDITQFLREKCDIMCLTETQLKYDKVGFPAGIERVESMREFKDKKGGGLLILFKKNGGIKMTKMETRHRDILHTRVEIANATFHLVLVYLSVVNTVADKDRNNRMRK